VGIGTVTVGMPAVFGAVIMSCGERCSQHTGKCCTSITTLLWK